MKPYHLLSYMALADERYVDEASELALARYRKRRKRARFIVAASLALVVLTGVAFAEPAVNAWNLRNTVVSWPSPALTGAQVKPSSGIYVSAEIPTRRKMDAGQPFTLSVGLGQAAAYEYATLVIDAPGFEITDKDGNTAKDRYVRTLTDFNSGDYGMLYNSRHAIKGCAYVEDFTFRYLGGDGEGSFDVLLSYLSDNSRSGDHVSLYYTVQAGQIKLTDKRPADGGQHAVLEEVNTVELSYEDYDVKVSATDPVLCRGESWRDKIDIGINWNGESFGQSDIFSEFLIELWPKDTAEGRGIRLVTPVISSFVPTGMIPADAPLGAYDLVVTWYGSGKERPRWVFEDFVEIVEAPEGADLLTREDLSVSVRMETVLLTPGLYVSKPWVEIEACIKESEEEYDTSLFTAELVWAEGKAGEDYSFFIQRPNLQTENGFLLLLVPRVPTEAPVGSYDLRVTDSKTGLVWLFENMATVVPPALHPEGDRYPPKEDFICEATAAKSRLRQGEYFVGEDFDVFEISVMHKNGEDRTAMCSAELVCSLSSDGRVGYSFSIKASALSSGTTAPCVPVDASPGYYDLVVRDGIHGHTWRFENFMTIIADPAAGVGG